MEPIRQAFAQLIAAHDGELRQQLQHAAAACAQQDFAPAHTVLAPLAAAGEAQAQFILGAFYLYAQGVAQDVYQAIAYWQQAAAQGMALAQTSLGALYAAQGRDDEARGLLAQAAAQGEGYAASALQMFGEQPSAAVQRAIRILREGDADGARRKLEALAREGNVEAIRYLAVMFQRGIGVAQDYAIAREWWGVALALQDDVAQYAMGELYFNGDGVTRDYAQARSYWEQATAKRNAAWVCFSATGMAWRRIIPRHGGGWRRRRNRDWRWRSMSLARCIRRASAARWMRRPHSTGGNWRHCKGMWMHSWR